MVCACLLYLFNLCWWCLGTRRICKLSFGLTDTSRSLSSTQISLCPGLWQHNHNSLSNMGRGSYTDFIYSIVFGLIRRSVSRWGWSLVCRVLLYEVCYYLVNTKSVSEQIWGEKQAAHLLKLTHVRSTRPDWKVCSDTRQARTLLHCRCLGLMSEHDDWWLQFKSPKPKNIHFTITNHKDKLQILSFENLSV